MHTRKWLCSRSVRASVTIEVGFCCSSDPPRLHTMIPKACDSPPLAAYAVSLSLHRPLPLLTPGARHASALHHPGTRSGLRLSSLQHFDSVRLSTVTLTAVLMPPPIVHHASPPAAPNTHHCPPPTTAMRRAVGPSLTRTARSTLSTSGGVCSSSGRLEPGSSTTPVGGGDGGREGQAAHATCVWSIGRDGCRYCANLPANLPSGAYLAKSIQSHVACGSTWINPYLPARTAAGCTSGPPPAGSRCRPVRQRLAVRGRGIMRTVRKPGYDGIGTCS